MREKDFFNRVKEPNYDFSNTKFIDLKTPIEVICCEHGLFTIIPSNMLYKREGCKLCGINKMAKSKAMSKAEFIIRAKRIYGDKYDYSLVNYINNKTKVKIIDKETGEIMDVLPVNFLKVKKEEYKND